MAAQALDGLGYGGVDLLGQTKHEDQGLDVAVPDAAAASTQDAADERGVLAVLDLRSGRFAVNPALTVSGLVSWAAGDELTSWVTACRGLVGPSC